MNTHLEIKVGGLKKPSNFSGLDAARLLHRCTTGLDVHSFPPKLFILWATPSFAPYDALVSDLREQLNKKGFRDVPLIGASVAACFFDRRVEQCGATLICLASRFMDIQVGSVQFSRNNPVGAAERLCRNLALGKAALSNTENSFLITFVAGHSAQLDPLDYRASEFFEGLRCSIGREFCVFGGVSSGGLERGPGHQFLNEKVLHDHNVSALVTSDVAFECGIHHGLKATGHRLTVTAVSEEGRVVAGFREGSPKAVLDTLPLRAVFTYEASDGRRIVVVPRIHNDQLKLLRPIPVGTQIEIMEPNGRRMAASVRQMEHRALERLRHPKQRIAGLLAIGCVSRYRYAEKLSFDVRAALEKVSERFPGATHAGCYMDGEIGTGLSGRPEFSNWSLSELLLGDEVPAMTEFRKSFRALARHAQRSRPSETIKDAMERALDCVVLAGYAGCMISLVVQQRGEDWVMPAVNCGKTLCWIRLPAG